MADHWNPRLAAPLRGAWLWSFSLFFIINRAIVASLTKTRCGMVTRRRTTKEGASAPLKWAVRHPPHDRVIIVFDAAHARRLHRSSKRQEERHEAN
jgi:hypothetical protein